MREALLEAAIAAYGEGTFTVRKVAARAGVNHGQIHHYFGGMDGLKQALLERLGGAIDGDLAEVPLDDPVGLFELAGRATLANRRFVHALARRVLEDPETGGYQVRFPVVTRLKEAVRSALGEDGDVLLAEGLARSLGWVLFSGWITEAVGLDEAAVARVEERLTRVPAEAVAAYEAQVGADATGADPGKAEDGR